MTDKKSSYLRGMTCFKSSFVRVLISSFLYQVLIGEFYIRKGLVFIPNFMCKMNVTDIFAAFYICETIIAKIKCSPMKGDLQYFSVYLMY